MTPTPSLETSSSPISFAVPLIDDDDVEAVVTVLRSGWLTTGEECLGLERELAEYLRIRHAVAMSSCTAALETAVAYLDLPPGSRVGVPTWTFVASALAPARHGALPVLLDVDPDTLNVSPSAVARALDEGLDALVLVHFAGLPVHKEVHSLCTEAGVPVIEDAAHALGATDHRGRIAGHGTVAACLSFYATKNLTSGEGGALTTDDDDLADFARSFRLHGLTRDAWSRYRTGSSPDYDLLTPGIKGNLPDILAALARSQLGRYDSIQAHRRRLVRRYRELLGRIDDLRCVPSELPEASADHLMVVVLPEAADRAAVIGHLARAGIGSSIHCQPLHHFTWFAKKAAIGAGGTPVADAVASRVVSLPLHPGLTIGDVDRVCDVLGSSLTL